MLLPGYLRQKSTQSYVNCLPAETRRKVLKLLKERRSLGVRRSLIEWCRFCGYEPAAHHRLLVSELEKVARGETSRLAIFMPPGSAKSTYASVLFPPWLLASSNWKHPCGFAYDRTGREVGAAHQELDIGAFVYSRHIASCRQPSGGAVVPQYRG